MKPLLWFAMTLAELAMLSGAGAAAGAQDSITARKWSLGVLGGGLDVTGDFRTRLKNGAGLGVAAQYPLPVRHLAVRGDVMLHYIWQEGLGDCVTSQPGYCSRDYSYSHIWSVSTDLVARLNDPATRWSPYVLGGAAVYETGGVREHISEFHPSQYGLQGGVGFDLRKDDKTLFVEIRSMRMSPGGVVLVTIGVRR